jgi:hypothetical protein
MVEILVQLVLMEFKAKTVLQEEELILAREELEEQPLAVRAAKVEKEELD